MKINFSKIKIPSPFEPPPLSKPTKEAPLMEEWRGIPSFPGYSVSTAGRVKNDKTGRLIVLCRNQIGTTLVGLSRDKTQHKRSVSLLVANAFIPIPYPHFNTPINLDGDRSNNNVFNLEWRPRWFAVDYFQQFLRPGRGYEVPIEEVTTGRKYPTSWDAAIANGLLHMDLVLSMSNNTIVLPTYQKFRLA